jgi:hypothetical protein
LTPPITPEQLEGLLERASALPSAYRPQEFDDWGVIRGPDTDSTIGPYKPVVATARDGKTGDIDLDEHRRNKTDPYGPNAELIVAAVNSLPSLLARIREMEKALEGVLPYVEAERLAELARARTDRTVRMPIRQAVKRARSALNRSTDNG